MSHKHSISLVMALTAGLSAFGDTPAPITPQVDPKTPSEEIKRALTFDPVSSSWNVSAGYQWRDMGSLHFHTGSAAAHISLPRMTGGGSGFSSSSSSSAFGNSSGAGSSNAHANRSYSDGYVNEDGGTATTGTTGFFGYNSDSQIFGNNLNYHNSYGTTTTSNSSVTSSFSSQSSSVRDSGWDSDVSGSGFFASLESPAVFSSKDLSMTFSLDYSFANADTSHETPGVFQAHQESMQRTTSSASTTTTTNSLTDSYDVTGLTLPSAPYQGTATGPGTLINNIPSDRSTTSSTAVSNSGGATVTRVQTADFVSNVNESLRMKLNTISIGPHLNWEKGRVQLALSGGFALNVADWDGTYREELNVRQNGGAYSLLRTFQYENNHLNVLPGAYGELSLRCRLTRHVALFIGGRYDWAGTLHGDVGPSNFNFKMQGASVLGGLDWVF